MVSVCIAYKKNGSKVFKSAENILYVKSLELTLENIHHIHVPVCDKCHLNLQIEKCFVFVNVLFIV